MTDKLPPPLLALFQPRPPLRYLPPSDRAPDDCQKSTLSGVAQFLADAKAFAEEVPYNATESVMQRKLREKAEKKEKFEKQITEGLQNCMLYLFTLLLCFKTLTWLCFKDNPDKDPQVRGDPFKTIFVSRLSYDTKETDLEREFGRFGPIERVCHVFLMLCENNKR
jgi:U1 small nuclear ribonucleoprotein